MSSDLTQRWLESPKKRRGTEKIFEEIMTKNVPNLIKIINHVSKKAKTKTQNPSTRNEAPPWHSIIKLLKITDKEKESSMYGKNHYNILISLQWIKINEEKKRILKQQRRTSLVVQWLRIHMPMQELVPSLIREDPTCHGTTGPRTTTTKAAL